MIEENEGILFVGEAEALAANKREDTIKTGFMMKKIVVTTRRVLLFEALSNKLKEAEYELSAPFGRKASSKSKTKSRDYRISTNWLPQVSLNLPGFECKVVIEDEAQLIKYLHKIGVKSLMKGVVGTVLFKNVPKKKFFILGFGNLKQSLRFAKAVICGQCWISYHQYCKENKQQVNYMWIRLLIEIINDEKSVVLVDPDMFSSGFPEEINTFKLLMILIPFAHCFHHRYSISNKESASFAIEFIVGMEAKIHSLNFSGTFMKGEQFRDIFSSLTIPNLLQLNLSNNQLDDDCLDVLQKLLKQDCEKLCYLNLSHNEIKLNIAMLLVQVLKAANTRLNIDLSHNEISDSASEVIEKFILFAANPPIEEINFSYNKFTRKTAWRLAVGNLVNLPQHSYLNFILYPVPIKSDIFSQYDIDFPRHREQINMNIHSALIQEFEEESILKHTFHNALDMGSNALIIKFLRIMREKVSLPINKRQLNLTLEISNKVENFIHVQQNVQAILNQAVELKNFKFEVPPVTLAHFVKYFSEKLDAAFFIRDHYSIRYLVQAMAELEIPLDGYSERLVKVQQRNKIFASRADNLLDLSIEEQDINNELDELVKEGLRLYLQGEGVELLYYLKYKRDQFIERYLNEKFNPEHYLFQLMATKNIAPDHQVSETQFIVPYEIRLQKRINQNFYLHSWQANYFILCRMKATQFQECLDFLQQSHKKDKFVNFFERIEERIQFIKNQFTYFTYKKFKASYSDLKINACRLLYLYNNINDTSFFREVPIYLRFNSITNQRVLNVGNPSRFRLVYHISEYKNINLNARKANIYNFTQIITRYETQAFIEDATKILSILNSILSMLSSDAIHHVPFEKTVSNLPFPLKTIINMVRHSAFPTELKEEIYLHLITWRNGKNGGNDEVIRLLPAITMYLKPPLELEKYLVAAILDNEGVDITEMPLCLTTNLKDPKPDQSMLRLQDEAFVQRDWLHSQQRFAEILLSKGKLTIQVYMLPREVITLQIAESKTVSELLSVLMTYSKMTTIDRENFWLYKQSVETKELIPLQGNEYIGQILAEAKNNKQVEDEWVILLKRRIFAREIKYIYRSCEQMLINSIYEDVKYDHLSGYFFVNDPNAYSLASIIYIVDYVQSKLSLRHGSELSESIDKDMFKDIDGLEKVCLTLFPKGTLSRLVQPNEQVLKQLKAHISERMLKREHLSLCEMKINFLQQFEKYPEFMSTNYRLNDKDGKYLMVSLNAMYIYISTEHAQEYIPMEKIILLMPRLNFLRIQYHKQENVVTNWAIFAEERMVLALCMDILSYCVMRLHMPSSNLYEIYHVQQMEKNKTSSEQLKKQYNKTAEVQLKKNQEEYEAIRKKLEKASITLMEFKDLPYYNNNHYIRDLKNRKMYGNRSENRIRFVEETEEDAKYFQERLKARKDYEGTKEQRVTFNLPGKEGWKPGMSQEVEQNSSIDYKQEHIRLEEAMRRTNQMNQFVSNKKIESEQPDSGFEKPINTTQNGKRTPQKQFQSTISKQAKETPNEVKMTDPQQQVVTGKKRDKPLPRRRKA